MKKKMMKVVITGSDGFVGSYLMSRCKELGYDVTGLDLPEDDITESSISDSIPIGTDVLVHLAALSTDKACKGKAYECFQVNVLGTLNLMRAAEKQGVKQFIFASSEWIYDDCNEWKKKTEDSIIDIRGLSSEYALSKLVSEANLYQKYKQGFCDTTILRFGIIYGNRSDGWSAVESLFHTVKTKDEVTVGSLRTGRCFIHVSDIAEGVIRSFGLHGFHILNLEGDTILRLDDIIEASERILGKSIAVCESDPGAVNVRNISNRKAKELLGWAPRVSLDDGLKMLKEYLEE